ncbi:MAG: hypothetical protein IT572_04420 [Deltaproteobacteria bacterium]|nr:hypothetical protein [Deltaproteobacteria bacterium]
MQAFLHPTFLYLVLIGNLILIAATFVVFHLERGVNPHMQHYFDSLWWGVTTITTVGFGDTVPVTPLGRWIGIGLMYTGTVLFISFTGMLVTYWLREEVEKELTPLEREMLQELKAQVQIEKSLRRIEERLDRLEKK